MIAVLSATHTGSPCTGVSRRQAPSFAGSRQPLIRFIPAVSPKRIVLHAQAAPRERRIVGSLSRFHPASCGYISVLVILPVLHDRQIDRTELIAYRFKVRPIPAVAAAILGVTNENWPTASGYASSPRPRRQHVDGELVMAGTACCQSASMAPRPFPSSADADPTPSGVMTRLIPTKPSNT